MSGIYIPNMKLPKEKDALIIMSDGFVYVREPDNYQTYMLQNSGIKAVTIRNHGRLIDVDSKTFPTAHRNESNDYMKGWNACLRSIKGQQTIVPSDNS